MLTVHESRARRGFLGHHPGSEPAALRCDRFTENGRDDRSASASRSRSCWKYTRFRVRTMIAVVLAVGGGLGWFVRQRTRPLRDAVESIERKEGGVQYDWEFKNGEDTPGGKPWAPQWLVDRLGVDYFGSVTSVNLNECLEYSDAELIHIGRFNRLETVGALQRGGDGRRSCSSRGPWQPPGVVPLSIIRISDQGLTNLEGVNKTRASLGLDDTDVTDAGLAHLKGLISTERTGTQGYQSYRCRPGPPEGADPPPSRVAPGRTRLGGTRPGRSQGADNLEALDSRRWPR